MAHASGGHRTFRPPVRPTHFLVPQLVVLTAHVVYHALLVLELLPTNAARINLGFTRAALNLTFVHERILFAAEFAVEQLPSPVQLDMQLETFGRPVDFPTVFAFVLRKDSHLSTAVDYHLVVLIAKVQRQIVRLGEPAVADFTHVWRLPGVDPYVDLERYRLGETFGTVWAHVWSFSWKRRGC